MKSFVYLAICLALNVGIATLSQGEDTQPAAFENLSDEEKKPFIALFKKPMEKKTENSRTVAPTTITKESTRSKKEKLDLLFDEFFSHYLEEKNKPTTMTITMPPKKDHDDMADMVQAFKEWLESRKEKPSTLDQEPTRMKTTKKTPTVKPATKATKGTIGKERLFDEFKKYKKFKEWWNSKEKLPTAQATTEGKKNTRKPTTVKPITEAVKETSGARLFDEFKKHIEQEFKEWLNSKEKPPTAQPTTKDEKETEKSSTVKPTTADEKGREKTAKVQSAAATTGNKDQTALTSNEHKTEAPESSSADSTFDSMILKYQGRSDFPIFFVVGITVIILLCFTYYNRKKIVSFVKRDGKNAHRRPFYMLRELKEEESMPFMDKSSQLYFIA